MKNKISVLLLCFLFASDFLMAQAGSSQSGGGWFIYLILAVVILLFFLVVIQVSDNMLAIEAKRIGADKDGTDYSIFPSTGSLFSKKRSENIPADARLVSLKQGHDILLEGGATGVTQNADGVTTYAINVKDFIGISPIPKVTVEVGDTVAAGDVLFFDKKVPEVKYSAPVSGEIIEVNRGEKRSISSIVILADKKIKFKSFKAPDIAKADRTELVDFMLGSGAWPLLRQRPYNIVPDFRAIPRDVFISTFDSAPLAPDSNQLIVGKEAAFQKGLEVLGALTSGKVHLGLNANGIPADVFAQATGVEKTWFTGKHPAGNVGVQIHNSKALAPNEMVWTLGVQEVASIGTLFLDGKFDASRVVALAGSELKEPQYVSTFQGARVEELLKDNLIQDHVRYISGDVLSGAQKAPDEFLGFYDDQITVIKEGDDFEMFGWLLPLKPRPSVSGTFPNKWIPSLTFKGETNTHGEERAFVVTGLYESLLPMDIYPQHLMKSILIGELEKMEGLGMYELVEEDIALCEFACVSKQPLQEILREGLDKMRIEG